MEEDEKKTVLFFCGRVPWKAIVAMPAMTRISVNLVRKALAQQGLLPPPPFPQGEFIVITNSPAVQVAIFRFRHAAGCRTTTSREHGQLPPPITAHKDTTMFIKEPNNLRVGFQFLYGKEHLYSVSDGNITITGSCPSPPEMERSEVERTVNLVAQLRARYGQEYIIRAGSGHDLSHYCPFSGGGDVHIFKADSATSAVVEVEPMEQPMESTSESTSIEGELESGPSESTSIEGELEAGPSESINVTPPKQGERRCSALETKGIRSLQSPSDVTLQLQADMILLCAALLTDMVASQPEHAESIWSLTCYGVQVGFSYPIKLLKLTIDFENRKVHFKELFNKPVCAFQGAYIDIALNYVFEALKKQ